MSFRYQSGSLVFLYVDVLSDGDIVMEKGMR